MQNQKHFSRSIHDVRQRRSDNRMTRRDTYICGFRIGDRVSSRESPFQTIPDGASGTVRNVWQPDVHEYRVRVEWDDPAYPLSFDWLPHQLAKL